MLTPRVQAVTRVTAGIFLPLLCVTAAWAADPAPADSTPQVSSSKEVREKLAALHEQMAACLRSQPSVAECRDEMRRSCLVTFSAQECRAMGMSRAPHIMKKLPDNTSRVGKLDSSSPTRNR